VATAGIAASHCPPGANQRFGYAEFNDPFKQRFGYAL